MEAEQLVRMSVSPEPTSVGRARTFLRTALDDWDADVFEEAATLLVSEVVTNLVLHARTAGELVVQLSDDRLRVELHDGTRALPHAKHYGLEATTGRGIGLLETMSSAWGAEVTSSGKRVWFELEASEPQTSPFDISAFFDADELAELDASVEGRRHGSEGPPDGAAARRPGRRPRARRSPLGTGRR
jgi:hypothetical protein